MNKKDRIAVVISFLYFCMLLPLITTHTSALSLYMPVVLYWCYRFIQNDISFLKIKDDSDIQSNTEKIEAENISKRNPQTIWQAVALGDKNLVLSIIESGENINMLDGVKQTAVDIAKNLGRSEIEALLRRHGGKSAREL